MKRLSCNPNTNIHTACTFTNMSSSSKEPKQVQYKVAGKFIPYITDLATQQILFRDIISSGCPDWIYDNCDGGGRHSCCFDKLDGFLYVGQYCGLTFKKYYNQEFSRDPPINIDSSNCHSNDIIEVPVMAFDDVSAKPCENKIAEVLDDVSKVYEHQKAIISDVLKTLGKESLDDGCNCLEGGHSLDEILGNNLIQNTLREVGKSLRKHRVILNPAGWKMIKDKLELCTI